MISRRVQPHKLAFSKENKRYLLIPAVLYILSKNFISNDIKRRWWVFQFLKSRPKDFFTYPIHTRHLPKEADHQYPQMQTLPTLSNFYCRYSILKVQCGSIGSTAVFVQQSNSALDLWILLFVLTTSASSSEAMNGKRNTMVLVLHLDMGSLDHNYLHTILVAA
jgi:hypothetical protein